MSKPSSDNTGLLAILALGLGIIGIRIWEYLKPILFRYYLNNRVSILFIISILITYLVCKGANKFLQKREKAVFEKEIIHNDKIENTFLGYTDTGETFTMALKYRKMHIQIVGTTNAGKTESVVAPLVIDDIEKGRGLIIIDGKSDLGLLSKIYAYCKLHNREHDFLLFSLSNYSCSQSFNPLIHDSVDQVTEKIINSFNIENEFYRTIQYDIFKNALSIFKGAREYPTFIKLSQAIKDPAKLNALAEKCKNQLLKEWALSFLNMNKDTRVEHTSGLVANLGYFISDEVSDLFNTPKPTMSISDVISQGKIAFFQLPVLKSPMLGKSVAKMVLQDIQSEVSVRHASGKEDHQFFSIYLDDFTEYLTKQFVSVLNKSRSANVGVVLAHQAIGDLETLGAEVKNQIVTNTNVKVFMRTNESSSTEEFAKMIGTKGAVKTTSRQTDGFMGPTKSKDGSVRDVEEFIVHPNVFKRELGVGEGVVIIPHEKGANSYKVKFQMRKNLGFVKLPDILKDEPEHLQVEVKSEVINQTENGSNTNSDAMMKRASNLNEPKQNTQTEEVAYE